MLVFSFFCFSQENYFDFQPSLYRFKKQLFISNKVIFFS